MKRALVIIGCLLLLIPMMGQVTVIEGKQTPVDSIRPAPSQEEGTNPSQTKKLDYGAELGTSFSYSPGFGSGLNTYVSPYLTYQLSQKFRVKAGFSVINTQLFDYHPWFIPESGSSLSGNYTSVLLYAQGQYQIGNRILLNGTVFKDFPLISDHPGYPYQGGGMQGVSMDITYKVGEHVYLQAGFNYLNSNGPTYYSPFYPSTPFSHSNIPFHW